MIKFRAVTRLIERPHQAVCQKRLVHIPSGAQENNGAKRQTHTSAAISKPLQPATASNVIEVDDKGATEYISFDPKTPVLLRMEKEYPGNKMPETVPMMLRNVAKDNADRIAVAYKENSTDKEWTKLTYAEHLKMVERVAKGFIALGLEESHSVGVMANNCLQWTTSSHAAMFAGGLICGIYQTSSADVVSHLARMSDMDILIVENLAMLKQALGHEYILECKVGPKLTIKQALPSVKVCIMINGTEEDLKMGQNYGPVISWQQLLEQGSLDLERLDNELENREQSLQPNKACMLIFTSGTTGPPKGAMLSHDNITWSSFISTQHYNWENESLMSFLPMSHVAAQMMDNYLTPCCAGTVYFGDKDCLRGTLVENLKSARPTRFVGVPRVWEKIKDRMTEVEAQASPIKKAIMNWAKAAALENHQQVMEGKVEYGVEHGSLKYRLAHKIVLSKIHEALGLDRTIDKRDGRVSGAAAINESTLNYFKSIGLFINNLYGATESSGPCHTNIQYGGGNKDGTVGTPFLGVRAHLINVDAETKEGEVAFHSRNTFMGYIKEEAKTRDTFTPDGVSCKTGDLGIVDSEGFLRITGRIKELIITQGGKNIAPVPIEEELKSKLSNIISQAVVVGDNQKYLSCLFTLQVTVDPTTLLPTETLNPGAVAWCKAILGDSDGSQVKSTNDFIKGPHAEKLRAAIQKSVELSNKKAETQVHQVKKFCVLPNEFSFHSGELGPTLKLKRHVVVKKYKTYIDQMY